MTTSLLILARAFHFGSGMILVGVVAFRWLVLLPAFAGAGDEAWPEFRPFSRRLNQWFMASGLILILSSLALFWAVAAGMSGSSLKESLNAETLGTVWFQTQFGVVSQWRLGLMILLGIAMWRLRRDHWQEQLAPSLLERVAGIITLTLLASFAGTGHAAATGGATLPLRITVDALHLAAAAIWPTGLLPFALFLAHVCRMEGSSVRVPILMAVRLFSDLSLVTVALLAITGMINGCFLVGSFSALFTTAYGQTLCLKLVLFGLMLGVASWNRFRLLPILFSGRAITDDSAVGMCLQRLRCFVLIELSLAATLVAIVSVLGTMPPPT